VRAHGRNVATVTLALTDGIKTNIEAANNEVTSNVDSKIIIELLIKPFVFT
jgi:hypothetical protein